MKREYVSQQIRKGNFETTFVLQNPTEFFEKFGLHKGVKSVSAHAVLAMIQEQIRITDQVSPHPRGESDLRFDAELARKLVGSLVRVPPQQEDAFKPFREVARKERDSAQESARAVLELREKMNADGACVEDWVEFMQERPNAEQIEKMYFATAPGRPTLQRDGVTLLDLNGPRPPKEMVSRDDHELVLEVAAIDVDNFSAQVRVHESTNATSRRLLHDADVSLTMRYENLPEARNDLVATLLGRTTIVVTAGVKPALRARHKSLSTIALRAVDPRFVSTHLREAVDILLRGLSEDEVSSLVARYSRTPD